MDGSNVSERRGIVLMRVAVAALVGLLPVVLGGCPQLQSDYSIVAAAGDSGPGDSGTESDAGGLSDGLVSDAGDAGSNCAPSPPTLCSGTYVDTMSSATNCGGCGNACATSVANAAPACVCGTCSFQCNSGYSRCGSACVNEQTDRRNCGTCGTQCNVLCSAGACVTAVAVAAGGGHSCAVLSNGRVECWGSNGNGQLGNGTIASVPPYGLLVPTPVLSVGDAVAITTGEEHTCVLRSGGAVSCWGVNGNGGSTATSQPTPVANLSGATSISAGAYHTCATTSGAVQCWGDNDIGQLGNGTTASVPVTTPVTVAGLTGVIAIAAGGYFEGHTCALLGDGTVRCWGDNGNGQLGNGTTTNSATPVTVTGLSGATAIEAGGEAACALVGGAGGTLECWGANNAGQLGNGAMGTAPVTTPVMATSPGGVTAVAAGGTNTGGYTCALLSGGTLKCWGSNARGQLGNGTMTSSLTPVPVSGLSSLRAIALGELHACALLASGTVACWGYNNYGQLGNGTTNDSSAPVEVSW